MSNDISWVLRPVFRNQCTVMQRIWKRMLKVVIWWCLDGKFCQRKLDLIAVINGGVEVIRRQNENITMNASLSYDPVVALGNHSGMNFTWHYGEIKGNDSGLQTAVRDSFIGINQSNVHYIWNDSGLEVTFNTASSTFQGLTTLLVKLVVTKGYRSSSAHQIIHLVNGNPPQISQRYKSCFIVYQSNHWPSTDQCKMHTVDCTDCRPGLNNWIVSHY